MTTKKKLAILAAGPVAAAALFGATFVSAHGMGFGMFGQQLTPQQIADAQTNRFQQEANLLGVSVDDIKNAWAQGKSFQQLAQDKGITQQQLQQKMQDLRLQQMKDNLKALVDKGVITQAQADQRLQFMQTQQQNGQGKGRGFGRGMHGMGMMGF